MTVDQRMWEMRNGAEIADIVRRVMREHVLHPEPDQQGRAMTCACGWWAPGTSWSVHLIDVLEQAGLDLGVKS